MAKAHVFQVPKKYARGYDFPPGRQPSTRPNPAGVTAIMGLSNGRGASDRARKAKQARRQCRDEQGRFVACDDYRSNRSRKSSRKSSIKSKRGGATCWKKPRKKYVSMGATKRSDYAYPECWAYPVNSRQRKWKRILPAQAAKWFSVYGDRYAPAVKKKISRRIEQAARREGLSVGRLTGSKRRRSRRNASGENMIVLKNREATQGAENMDSYGFEVYSDDDGGDFEPNRRRRGRKSRRRGRKVRWSRKRSRRGSKRRSWGKKRRSSKRRSWGKKRRSTRRSWGKKRRSSKRRSWGRKRRSSKRYGAKRRSWGSKRRGRGRRRSRRSYRRNAFGESPEMREYIAARRAQRKGADFQGLSPQKREFAKAQLRQAHMRALMRGQRRTGYGAGMSAGHRAWPWGSPFSPPWDRPKPPKPPKPHYPPGTRDLLFRGYKPRDLFRAMKDLNEEQIRAMFPTYGAYKRFMRHALRDKRFRRYRGKFASGRRYGRGRRRWGRKRRWGKKRYGRGRRRWGKKRYGRGRRRWGKKRYGRGRRRWSKRRRYGRGRRRYARRYRRNFGMVPNMPYLGVKELAFSGLAAVGGYSLPAIANMLLSMVHPLAGTAGGVAAGVATVMYSDRVLTNDAYAKGAAVGGVLGLVSQVLKAITVLTGSSLASKLGMGSVGFESTRSNYALNPFGQFQQAAAGTGQFQQALANPFLQAQAGFGEYVQGTGEYVSNDGSMAPVSNFGEYVSSGINVQGYSDYEVMPEYTASADGLGYVNDGVHPNSNMDSEFDIIEAAAGLGGGVARGPQPMVASDYIPSGQAGYVASHGSSPDAGIFDVGGPNGVFG